MKKMWIAVVGRIPEDDEDSIYVYKNVSVPEAMKLFEKDIYFDSIISPQRKREIKRVYGSTIFINWILYSEAEIKAECYM